jgi:hypothetical protein
MNLEGCGGMHVRHYATSQKVASLSPNEITGFFKPPTPSSCITFLAFTQHIAELSTRISIWGQNTTGV